MKRLTQIALTTSLFACGTPVSPEETAATGVTLCDDGNACTQDRWAESLGRCLFENLSQTPCDDGDPCTPDDRCLRGVCIGCGNADTPECACRAGSPRGGPYAKMAEELCDE